jgi:hypothetical protein
MLIEKTKFLTLVAAIAAASTACVIVDGDGDDDDGNGGQGGEGGKTTGPTGGGGEGGGTACTDDVGTPGACDSTCEGFTNCGGIVNFKDGVAEELVTCLNGLDPVTCGFEQDVVVGCYQPAMNNACVDATAEAVCSEIATNCAVTDDQAFQDGCQPYIWGLSVTGRDVFQTCVETGCTGAGMVDFDSCIIDLFPAG